MWIKINRKGYVSAKKAMCWLVDRRRAFGISIDIFVLNKNHL